MQKIITTLIPILIGFSLTCKGQQNIDSWQETTLEFLEASYSEDETIDAQQLLEDLQKFVEKPININQCTPEDLLQLGLLNPVEIQNILKYRDEYGEILSINELIAVDGLSKDVIKIIQPFIQFGSVTSTNTKIYSRQEFLIRASQLHERQKGFKEPAKYEGSPLKLYSRYRYTSSQLQAGMTAEKDPGESFFQGANKNGFDFYSGHLAYSNKNGNIHFIAGDYRLQFGQGLAAWQGFSIGKSSEPTQGAKFNQGIRPYTSTDENLFMRGISGTFVLGKFTLSPFVSYKKFDANTDSIDAQKVFTSFQTSGLHRTNSEIDDKKSVRERTLGSYFTYIGRSYKIGTSILNTRYNLPLDRKDADYNQYLFEGKQITNFSIDYQLGLDRIFIFSELAGCSTKGLAGLTGLLSKPTDKIEATIIFRNIGKKYNSPFAMAFTEGSKVNDEKGLYLGSKILISPKVSLNLYADFFKYEWTKYTTIGPSEGREYMIQLNYQLARFWKFYVHYFNERKAVKATVNSEKVNLDQQREKLRWNISGNISPQFFSRTRLEMSFYSHDHRSNGFMLFHDIGYEPSKFPSKWWFRIAYFNTDDYDSRIYAYENDLLYQFSVPAFYGEGVRSYINGKVKICEKIDLWFKCSRTWFFGVESIGSSYSQIDGHTKTESKIQVRYRF